MERKIGDLMINGCRERIINLKYYLIFFFLNFKIFTKNNPFLNNFCFYQDIANDLFKQFFYEVQALL